MTKPLKNTAKMGEKKKKVKTKQWFGTALKGNVK